MKNQETHVLGILGDFIEQVGTSWSNGSVKGVDSETDILIAFILCQSPSPP